ncbi:MAG: hypothetical protein QOI98_3129 [Solirubrobacteraceae bacterium]|jgi:hypothetical protein|nr:hypothetical protein [Solirubrobacteraceae bacterium]
MKIFALVVLFSSVIVTKPIVPAPNPSSRRRVVDVPPCRPIVYRSGDCAVVINCDGTFTLGCP